MASFLRKEIQATVREEISRVIGTSTDPIPTTTAVTYRRSSTAEIRTGAGRDSSSTSTSSTEEQTCRLENSMPLEKKNVRMDLYHPRRK